MNIIIRDSSTFKTPDKSANVNTVQSFENSITYIYYKNIIIKIENNNMYRPIK